MMDENEKIRRNAMSEYVPELPQLSYFQNKNLFSGEHEGLRFRIAPNAEEKTLTLTLWPGPYAVEFTAPEKQKESSFPMTEDGLLSLCSHIGACAAAFVQQIQSGALTLEHPFGR